MLEIGQVGDYYILIILIYDLKFWGNEPSNIFLTCWNIYNFMFYEMGLLDVNNGSRIHVISNIYKCDNVYCCYKTVYNSKPFYFIIFYLLFYIIPTI